MSMAPIHSRFSRKTLAIALAAGVATGGVTIAQIADVNGIAATASAAELDPSVVAKIELVSDKSGKNVFGTTVKATREAYDAFYDTHGEEFKLKLDLKIPDTAQPGDTFTLSKNTYGQFQVRGTIDAATEEGRKVGQLNVQTDRATFTVSNQVANAQKRTASFEVPVHIIPKKNVSPIVITTNKSLDGTSADSLVYSFSPTNEKLIFERVYEYSAKVVNTAPQLKKFDTPFVSGFSRVNLDTGQTTNDDFSFMNIGHANIFLESVGNNTDKSATYDDVYKLDETAKNHRDVTIRYTIDDPQGRLIPTPRNMYKLVYEFSPTGFTNPDGKTPSSETNNEMPYFFKSISGDDIKVTYKRINDQTIDVVVHDVPPNYAIELAGIVRTESPYSPGKKITLTKTFVNGVGEPHSAYDQNYYESRSTTYTHPSFAGYGSAEDIKRNITMSAKVNGQDANNVNSAVQVTGGKANFSIDLKNNGNIGTGSATVKYPKGVTGPNGETEKFIDFGNGGLPAGSTRTLDLGELNVPEGTNENEFTVIMTGYPELTDTAWTATGPTDIYVDKIERKDDTVTITRNDGKDFTFRVNDTNGIKDVIDNGDGSITIVHDNGDKETIDLTHTTVTEANKGKPNHTITITVPGKKPFTFNAYDTYITDIVKNDEGDYDVYRSDVEGVWKTIKFDELREEIKNLKGKDAKQDKRLDNLEDKLNDANDDLKGLANKVAKNTGAIEDHRKTIGDILVTIGNIEGDIKNIQDELIRLNGQDIKEVRDNGDGTYTLIRNNNDEIDVNISSSETATGITPNTDGSITIHKIDGSEVTVPLAKVKITEANKDTPNHTITITVPGEKPFTFNAYDNYIVDVKRENNGNYTVVRRDGASWEINLKDIRDRITALEAKDSPTRDEFDDVKKDLADLTARVDAEFTNIDKRFTKAEGDITNLRNDLTALENRVTKIEARLTKVEGRTDAITKCLYGTGMVAIPTALGLPLALMTQIQIPGIAQLNADIQRQIGIYNEDLATMWGQYGGVLQAAAAVSVLASMIGGLAYITNECKPLTQTDAAQATDLGKLSAKMEKSFSR